MQGVADALLVALQVWLVTLPLLGIWAGWRQKMRWLIGYAALGLVVLAAWVATFLHLVNSSQIPNANGLQGLLLFIYPTSCAAAVLLAALFYTGATIFKKFRDPR